MLMPSVTIQSIMLNVIMLSVVMLNVVELFGNEGRQNILNLINSK
jgi:hypothetical protein